MAQGRVLDDAVDVPVNGIALGEDVVVDDGPHGEGDKGGGVGGALQGVKGATPGGEVVKGQGGRAHDPAVKVVGEVLRRLEALAAARGAAEVVGLVVGGAVKGLGEDLAHDDARVHGAVGKVLDDLAVVVKGEATRAIVAIVGGDGGEAQVDRVGEVDVLDAAAEAAVAGAQEAAGPGVRGRQPGLHGQVGAVRGGHQERDTAHVDGDDLGALAARGVRVGEGEVGARGDGGRELHRGVGVEGAHGGGEVGALGGEGGGTVLGEHVGGGGGGGGDGGEGGGEGPGPRGPGRKGRRELHGQVLQVGYRWRIQKKAEQILHCRSFSFLYILLLYVQYAPGW